MIRLLPSAVLFATGWLLSSCAVFTPPEHFPDANLRRSTIGQTGEAVGLFATPSERRVVVVNERDKTFCAEPPPDVAANVLTDLSQAIQAGLSVGSVAGAQSTVAPPAGGNSASSNHDVDVSQADDEVQAPAEVGSQSTPEGKEPDVESEDAAPSPEVGARPAAVPGTAGASFGLATTERIVSIIQALFTPTQGNQLFRVGTYNLCQAYVNGILTSEQYEANFQRMLSTSSELIELELVLNAATASAEAADPQDIVSAVDALYKFRDVVEDGVVDERE